MNTSDSFRIGRIGASTLQRDYSSLSRNARPVRRRNTPGMTIDEVREQLRAATAALGGAFHGLAMKTKPVFESSIFTTPSQVAKVTGYGAHLTPVDETYSALQTTLKINTQTSTVRSSTSEIDLDITSMQ